MRGIYRIAVDQSRFSPPDNKTYSIEGKIDFNQITYFKPYDQYQEGYDLIRDQIITLSTIDPFCEKALSDMSAHCAGKLFVTQKHPTKSSGISIPN